MPAATLNPFKTLQRHRNFRIFWMGQTLSLIGTWMQTMALGWLALQLSNSAFIVGLVATVQSLPVVLFSLPAGVIVDRSDKMRIVRLGQALLGVHATALWWFTWSGHITVGWLLALAVMSGLINSVEIPARQSLIVELVGRDDLRGAIALNSSGFNLARVVGPSIGAAVIATLGLAWCFGVNAISYIAVLASLFLIRLPRFHGSDALASPIEGLREGLSYMRGTPSVSALMKLVAVYSILGVPYLTLMPVVARDLLKLDAGGYGVLLSCVGIGGLSGALWLAGVGQRFGRGVVLSTATYAYGSLLILFSLARVPWLAYIILLATGFAMIVNSAQANSLLQQLVPDALRGRLMAAYALIVVGLSQVLGSFTAGAMARIVGVDWAIGGGGMLMLVYAIWAFRRRPEMREL